MPAAVYAYVRTRLRLLRKRGPLRILFTLTLTAVCTLLGFACWALVLTPASAGPPAVARSGWNSRLVYLSATSYDPELDVPETEGAESTPESRRIVKTPADLLASANALARSPNFTDAIARRAGLPPVYLRFREAEAELDELRAGENSEKGKGYLFFANHAHHSGWGNALQELLLNAELAFRANRAFVTDDYTWEREGGPYAYPDSANDTQSSKLMPTRIPLAALLGGLPVGAPLPQQFFDTHPRAVSRAAFVRACPKPEVLDAATVKDTIPPDAPAPRIFAAWVAALDTRGPCVMIEKDSPQIFDIWLFGSPKRLLPAWPALCVSPIITRFRWPPLITAALVRNARRFPALPENREPWYMRLWPWRAPYNRQPAAVRSSSSSAGNDDEELPPVYDFPLSDARPHLSSQSPLVPDDTSPERTYTDAHPPPAPPLVPGLLALHVRRGDFAAHCTHLANWGAEFNAFNSFGRLYPRPEWANGTYETGEEEEGRGLEGPWGEEERFVRPEGGGWGSTTPANHALYLRRCFPSIPQIVERVRTVFEARTRRRLGWIYVMTNAEPRWLRELEAALRAAWVDVGVGVANPRRPRTWDGISMSHDLVLTWEQQYVAQALDMYIATRAEVFIGNGFSSLTSNAVMLRMAHDIEPRDTHFW
ncbi:hypothetical protein C8R46DRAFT_1041213 [Mycena filopes]|nr:hypothetical protein C8R46DRAFT_1041213 [Mycena filopes]